MFSKLVEGVRTGAERVLHDSLGLPRSAKRLIVVLVDVALALAAVWLAFYLRLGEWNYVSNNQWLSVVLALCAIPILWVFGLYKALFRHNGLEALVGIARACFVYALLYAVVFLLLGVSGVPRTVGLIQPLLYFFMVGASRIALRSMFGRIGSQGGRPRVLIYGAGESGRQLASAITGSREMELMGFVDDDAGLHQSTLNGKSIYAPAELANIVERRDITDILLALPSATRARRNEIVETLRSLNLNVRTVPGLMDLASGRVQVDAIRPLDIEDLLGRDPVEPDEMLFARNIADKVVMVTGSGGSIGSELCRQIIGAGPRTLLLVEQSEYALYMVDAELRKSRLAGKNVEIVPLLASVQDERRINAILKAWRPDTIYHAAAYKHVPIVERNVTEGVWNNVFGTYRTALAAKRWGVKDFVLISTDKAVRPTSVMGATKRMAELSLQALADAGGRTCFSMVRFGNVLGSSGSVVPLFRSQIARGGPVTVTDADITRYFMTIPEAAQLVIQAGAMAEGGEVFILDMGEPVRIMDLAHKMVELSGATVRDKKNPTGDIEIVVMGLRPGEKLYEELLISDNPIQTSHPRIMKSREHFFPARRFEALIQRMEVVLDSNDAAAIHALLCEVVPEFASSAGVIDLVQAADQHDAYPFLNVVARDDRSERLEERTADDFDKQAG
jgi:FlaA1/EpsC-like NDP-sugar epimerase